MRLRSLPTLAAGVTVLALLAGGATALAESGSSSSGGSTRASGIQSGLFATTLGRGLVAAPVGRRAVVAGCPVPVPLGDPLKAAADYLGIAVDKLSKELEGDASLAEIATEQGKSVDGLKQALIDGAKAELDKSVAAGDITADQEQQMLSKLGSRVDDLVDRKGGVSFPPTKPPLGDPVEAAAGYLGLSVDQLGQELQGGKSLADVAKAQGKSVDGLEQALIAAAKSDLGKSVAAGEITADQEQQIIGQLSSQVDAFVNGNGGLSIRIGKGGLSIRIGGHASDVVLGGPYKTAADYLGLAVDQLTKELQAGKSLADIAAEQGKSVDGLKQALVAAETADIETAVNKLVNEKGLPGPRCGAGVVAAGVLPPAPGFGLPGTP